MKWDSIKKLGLAIGIATLAMAAPLVVLPLMLILTSERTVYERVKSPDGWHEARVQFDDGGAVSGFKRLVFVKHTWNFSDQPLLSCRAFWADGEAKVRLRWPDSSTLVVEHHVAPKNIVETVERCGPIKIILHPTPPFEDR